MHIGLLGGTFNPIHLGHLRIAAAACQACQLDEVLFLPASQPPHKEVAYQVSFADRLKMVELALQQEPNYRSCDIEGRRSEQSYSVETLLILRQERPQDEFSFIMGLDSFAEIALWKDYTQLFQLCHIIVAARPGHNHSLAELLPVAVANRFCYDAVALRLEGVDGYHVTLLEDTCFDLSSTAIRAAYSHNCPLKNAVPGAVDHYIKQQGLYLSQAKPDEENPCDH